MLAAGCVSVLAMSIPAFGLPASKGATQHAAQTKKPIQPVAGAAAAKKSIAKSHVARDRAKPGATRERPAARLISMPVVEPLRRPLFGWPALVREARRYMGTNPTARTRLWCATFMNLVLAKAGYAGTNSDAAKSFTDYGHRIAGPEVGAIAVLTRGKRGGHVGVVTGIDPHGNPIIISGNHGHRVGEGVYPRSRVIAYVMPTERRPATATQLASLVTTAGPNTPNQASSGPVIDSPITELLAAIEAEQNRSNDRVRLTRTPVPPPAPPRPAQLAAEQPVPQRLVQQLPDQVQMPAPQWRRDLPPIQRVSGTARMSERTPPYRDPQRLQRPGHVASATGRPTSPR